MRLHSQIGVMWWEEGIGHQECLLPARRGGSQTHADIRLWAPRRGDPSSRSMCASSTAWPRELLPRRGKSGETLVDSCPHSFLSNHWPSITS
jgi:hypothetical protein